MDGAAALDRGPRRPHGMSALGQWLLPIVEGGGVLVSSFPAPTEISWGPSCSSHVADTLRGKQTGPDVWTDAPWH